MAKFPPLNALKCFEAAARSASFSRAAEELHVTQSAVSHQIRQLEQWFGVALFDRQGRQTVPTARGQDLARALAEAFDIIGSACRRIALPESSPALTIAALPSVATIWLIPRLSHFFRAHPHISVKVIYAFHNQRIDFDEVDIAVLWGTGDWEDCRKTKLLDGATYAVCNPSLLARLGPIKTPADLINKPLLHDTDRQGWQAWLRQAGVRTGETLAGPIFEDFNLLRAAVLSGQGLALCPRLLIQDDIASGRLQVLFDVQVFTDHAYHIVEPADPHHRHAAAIATFKEWLLSEAVGP